MKQKKDPGSPEKCWMGWKSDSRLLRTRSNYGGGLTEEPSLWLLPTEHQMILFGLLLLFCKEGMGIHFPRLYLPL